MTSESMPLTIGLRLDVLDNEGIWNTGVVVDVAQDDDDEEMVEIKYDGWGDEYNEWVNVADQRLAPLHMFTIVKKCWAKLAKWPWWPAFVVLRAPTKRGAVESLGAETKVFVEFFDSFDEDKRSRCWMQRKSVVSFDDNFEDRAGKNVGKNFHKFVEHTQRASASSSPLLFVGNGTLPIEYSSKSPLSFTAQKNKLGDKAWYAAYTSFSARYRVLYGLETAAGDRTGSSANSDDDAPTTRAAASAGVADEDAEIAEGAVYAVDDDSDENEDAADEDASDAGDDLDDEAPESARGRRSGRTTAAPRKRSRPARASTRRNVQKRVKAIDLLLQATTPTPRMSSCVAPPRVPQVTAAVAATAALVRATDSVDINYNGNSSTTREAATPHPSSVVATSSEDLKAVKAMTKRVLAPKASVTLSPIELDKSNSQIYVFGSSDEDGSSSTQPAASKAAQHSSDNILSIQRGRTASAAAASLTRVSVSSSPSLHRRKLLRAPSIGLDWPSTAVEASVSSYDSKRHLSIDALLRSGGNGKAQFEADDAPWKIQRWLLHGLQQNVTQI